jgi:hypothetical protein
MADEIDKIGEAAGKVWNALEGKSAGLSPVQLKSATNLGGDLLNQALGWLAREDKIQFLGAGKSARVALK